MVDTAPVNRLFAADALLPTGWARDVLLAWNPDGQLTAVTADSVRPEGVPEVDGPVMPGLPNLHSHAFQRAFAGSDRIPQRTSRQLLELAHADVPLRPAHHARAAGGHRHLALRRDAGGRLHRGLRVPLCAPRPGRPAVRRRCHAVAVPAARGQDGGHRPDPAAGALPDRRLWRHAPGGRATALHPQHRQHAAPAGTAEAAVRGAGRAPGPGPTFLAGRAARCAARGPGRAARPRRHRTGAHPHRRADRRGRRLPGLERPAAGGMAVEPCAGGCALVPGACHAPERAGNRPGRGQRRRGRHLPQHRSQPGRRHLRHAGLASRRAGAGDWAPTATRRSTRPRS